MHERATRSSVPDDPVRPCVQALLWPSVLDDDPNLRDDRTDHESVAVGSGVKYSANYWLHM